MPKRNGQSLFGKIISPLREFIQDSRAVGITLICCTVFSLILSNSAWSGGYLAFWNTEVRSPMDGIHLPHTLVHFINDALMAAFFLLAGMEIKREILEGELSSFKKSSLPVFAAIGGMLAPAGIYLLWNVKSGFAHGWGIPMATDIAFSLGVLSLLGKRAPFALKILLVALAIIDDLGAILAIAVFYTDHINWLYLGISGALFLLLILLNLFKVQRLYPYFLVGILLWYCMFNSGVHATLAGVMLAFTMPLKKIPALEHSLHDPVNFIVLPLFAFANTAIAFPDQMTTVLSSRVNYGILFGLVLGKPLGIFGISWLTVKLRVAGLPKGISWKHIAGMGMIAGIGFTMSIFISMLAFKDTEARDIAKLAVLFASLIAGLAGYIYLRLLDKKQTSSIAS